jgi:hypothetical protein
MCANFICSYIAQVTKHKSILNYLLLPILVVPFSVGFIFSKVDSDTVPGEKAAESYQSLLYSLDIQEDITYVNGSKTWRYSLLNLSSAKQNYNLEIEADSKPDEITEIPESTPLQSGQSSKVATAKVRLKVSKKQKSKLKKSQSAWKPKSRSLAKIYRKVASKKVIPRRALINAFKFYEKNKRKRQLSGKYIAVADYTKNARSERLHLVNLTTGAISSYKVAHGRRSGPVGGKVHSTSNRRGSNKTSKGFFKVGYKEGVTRTKGYRYLSVTGLEQGNRKVGLPSRLGGRDVVMHTARYVNNGGRSNGCFAIKPQDKRSIFNKIKGSLLYSYTGNA